jgi:type IV pilus assembly protein PilA
MKKGFTLLEILLVVGIIAILAGIVIVALNPTKQFASVRNTQRKANLSELNKALYQYYIDHSHYPATLTTTLTEICATGASSTPTGIVCTGLVDLSALVPTYLVAIPTDPQGSTLSLIPVAYATTNGTGYKVALNAANKVTLSAPQSELNLPVTIGDTTGVLPDHLVSYWSFDDAGSGTALDTMGVNNGTVIGSVATTGLRSVSSTAYAFDGVNDWIDCGANINPGTAFTLSAWIKANNLNNLDYIINKGYLTDIGAAYILKSNGTSGLGLYWGDGTTMDSLILGSGIITNNQWYYVAATFNSGVANIYVNGVNRGSKVSAVTRAQSRDWSTNIGRYWGGAPAYYFNGAIDNVRIYNSTLSADDIMLIFNFEKP